MLYNPQLKTFIQVAETGSFSKAADSLFIIPTAVIKQITLLVQDLVIRLFILTQAGDASGPRGNEVQT